MDALRNLNGLRQICSAAAGNRGDVAQISGEDIVRGMITIRAW